MNIASPHFWPAEWETQAAIWISWPHNLETWPGRFERIPEVFVKFVHSLSQVQTVHLLSGPTGRSPSAEEMLAGVSNVQIHPVSTNDVWIRDYGPTFVRRRDDGSLVGIDWRYNAWGNKYPPFDQDAAVSEWVCRYLRCQRSVSPMYCEGGALETNGQGVLLTTSSCLMSPTRNPGWTRQMIEQELKSQLGVNSIVWVDGGTMQGDDTDGHIDQLARFVDSKTVVVATSSDPQDPNRDGLEENVRLLSRASTVEGETLNVVRLPTPPPRFVDTKRVPESYCNFLIANQIVIVPTFRSPGTDQSAVEILSRLFPTRRVIGLDAYELIWGLGAYHCASQHQPTVK